MSRAIHRIIIHCAATPNGRVLGRDGENAAQVIDADGQLLTGRGVEEVGAHVRGYNADSLGLCLVGTDQFTAAQWAVLRTQVLTLRLRGTSRRCATICVS